MSKDVAPKPRAVPFGSYYLLERLAVGGMAEVYLAKSFAPGGADRLVALKRILPSIAEDDDFIAMFIDEAKIAGQLNHANVAQIFDLGKINSSYFIAMEYVSGHDLRALWERTRDSGEGLPIGLACYVTQKICDGLDYAHRRRDNRGRPLNIIHRDVSPQNILMSYDGDVKVIDFGIAKATNRMVRTQTGILKGKFAYMAPEQARGEPTDHRADIFAIGVILYELLTGERAFKAESDFALLEKVRKVDLVPPRKLKPQIPRDLERIVYKAMEREAVDRYPHASVMAGELDRFMQTHNFTYNREETAAFLRRTFREEHEEEKRRLEIYRAFQVERTAAKPTTPAGDTRPSASPALPDQATRVKSDPSLDERDDDEEIHYLGTAMGEAESDDDAADGFARPEPTELLEDEAERARVLAAARAARVGSRARALDVGAPEGADDAATTHVHQHGDVAPSRLDVDKTRVFSSAEESEGGATMLEEGVDDGAAAELDSARADSSRDERRGPRPRPEGTRPDVRASALSHVLSESGAAVGDDAPARRTDENAAVIRRRGRSEWSAEAITTPPPVAEPSSRAPPPPQAVPVPTIAATNAPRERAIGAAMGAAMGLAVGLLVALVVGLFVGGHDTIVLANPRDARVKELEETICEKTPCAVRLGRGKHELVFLADGHDPLSRTVDVTGDEPVVVDVELPRRTSGLVLETEPPGARVSLNDKELPGVTPLPLPELVVGDKIDLSIAMKGYETFREIVEVPDAKSGPWRFPLLASSTTWTVTPTPADAIVVGDDGRAQEGKATLKVERNKGIAFRVLRPGCDPAAGALQGTGRATEEHEVRLTCRSFDSRLSVTTRAKVEFVIDGVELPGRRALSGYELPAGPHEIVVKGRRGREEALTVELRRGEALEVASKVR